jgi:RNA polymerase sigma-70 factor (ECF subfamily)
VSTSFEALTRDLEPQLRSYLRRMVRNAADAEDLFQETLLRIARGLPGFEGRASAKNWAYRIASNVAIDFLRRSKRSTIVDFDAMPPEETATEDDDEDRLVLDEMNACVREVIESLPPRYRAALVLHHLEGKTAAETARILEISTGNAKIRIHRAKERLREALDRECDFYASDGGTLRCDRKSPG